MTGRSSALVERPGGALRGPSFLDPVARRYELEKLDRGRFSIRSREQVNVELAKKFARLKREREEQHGRRKNAEYQPVAAIPWPTMRVLAARHSIDPVNCLQNPDWQPPTQEQMRKLERIIEQECPHLKTTNTKLHRRW